MEMDTANVAGAGRVWKRRRVKTWPPGKDYKRRRRCASEHRFFSVGNRGQWKMIRE